MFTIAGDDRPNVQDILIVFTDGAARDQDDAKRYAQNLKNRDVHIVGIAAGQKRHEFRHQLVEIATSEDDVIMVEFDDLDNIIRGLVNKVCKNPPSKEMTKCSLKKCSTLNNTFLLTVSFPSLISDTTVSGFSIFAFVRFM